MKLTNEFQSIRDWAWDKGIIQQDDLKMQFLKLLEEVGELSEAIQKGNQADFKDAIGDCVVVLTNLAAIEGEHIEYCINSAYSVIAKRTGKMVNGCFVKDGVK